MNSSSLYDDYASAQSYREHMPLTLFYGKKDFEEHVKPYLPKDKSIRILDIGCGHGTCINELIKSGYVNVEGVDISPDQIALAKEQFRLQNVFCEDPIEFLENKSDYYEVILLTNLLEHLELNYSIELLKKVHLSLKKTGFFIAQVPNAFSPFCPHLYMDITHLRAYSTTSFSQLFKMAGFSKGSFSPVFPRAISKFRNFMTKFLWKCILNPLLAIYFSASLNCRIGSVYTPNLLAIVHKSELN